MKRLKKMLLFGAFALALLASVKGSAQDMELWGTSVSPYVRKVQNVLDYKRISYKQHDILPKVLLEATGQEVPSQFLEASPLGRIPALTTGRVTAFDSSVIVMYLDKKFPAKHVYPKNEAKFIKAAELEEYSDSDLTKVVYPIFFERVVKPAVLSKPADEEIVSQVIKEKLPAVLAYLNKQLIDNSSNFMVCDRLTIADFAIIHHLINLDVAEVEWKTGQFPELERYYQQMIKEQVILRSLPKMFLDKIG